MKRKRAKKQQAGKGVEGKQGGCKMHQEPLKLFCFDDQAPLCTVCNQSLGHQNHRVLPIEEAFLEYKKEIQAQLQFLKQEREKLKEEKIAKDQRNQEFLAQLELGQQKTKSTFQQMHKYLEQQEKLRLSQLEKMKGEIEERDKENHARFSEEISDLSHLITELEGKFQQPEIVFLQEPKTILSRHKRPERQLVELPPILEQNLRISLGQTSELQKALKECEESLEKALTKVNVTLDPETAHPDLRLSKDLKSATRKWGTQNLPNNPERFDTLQSVLGREKFTSGRHWWEVDLGNIKSSWVVGVARESVKRKGYITLNPDEGFWVLQSEEDYDSFDSDWQICALTSSEQPNEITEEAKQSNSTNVLFIQGSEIVYENYLPKIRVLLDYEEGLVAFLSVPANEWLFTFPSASFSGEALRPYFCIKDGITLKC